MKNLIVIVSGIFSLIFLGCDLGITNNSLDPNPVPIVIHPTLEEQIKSCTVRSRDAMCSPGLYCEKVTRLLNLNNSHSVSVDSLNWVKYQVGTVYEPCMSGK